jgi:Plant transposon protein
MLILRYYFSGEQSVYNEQDFETRFRMSRAIFMCIYKELVGKDPLFTQQKSAIGAKPDGIVPLCRLTACIKKLCYGNADDQYDEYLQLSKTSLNKSMKVFTRLMVDKFGDEFLNRAPTPEEKNRCARMMQQRYFPGCFGAWDCKHFVWKNCPTGLHGQYKGHAEGGKKTIILEAIADNNCYIWYIFFGEPGSLNDLNVLKKSSIVGDILNQTFDTKIDPYTVDGIQRDWLYFLVDGIYPPWSIFIKPFRAPIDDRQTNFNRAQESARKCVERCFGILVAKFHILKYSLRRWSKDDILYVLYTCVILHNMVQAVAKDDFNFNNSNCNNLIEEYDEVEGDDEANEPVGLDGANRGNRGRHRRQQQQQQEEQRNLFGFEEQAFNPLMTNAMALRVARMQDHIANRGEHNDLTHNLVAHINMNRN